MTSESEGHLVSDHRVIPNYIYRRIGMAFVAIAFLVGAVYAGYAYYALPSIVAVQDEQLLTSIIDQLEGAVGKEVFSIVPNAPSTITVPPPPVVSVDELRRDLMAARDDLPALEYTEAPSLYAMPVGDVTYLEYLSTVTPEIQTPLYQMHVELRNLTKQFNQQYPQVTVASRIGEPELALFTELANDAAGALSVYPSLNVVEARFVSEVLALQFPSEAAFFRDFANNFINEGVMYGHYTITEAMSASALADTYLMAARQNPETAVVFQSLE